MRMRSWLYNRIQDHSGCEESRAFMSAEQFCGARKARQGLDSNESPGQYYLSRSIQLS